MFVNDGGGFCRCLYQNPQNQQNRSDNGKIKEYVNMRENFEPKVSDEVLPVTYNVWIGKN